MSYCRWSTDNFRSDVYVYEDSRGGWTTHVAVRRRVGPRLPDAPLSLLRRDTRLRRLVWRAWRAAADTSLSLCPLVRIGGPVDGKTFNDPTARECAMTLARLIVAGYRVPDGVIENLLEEAAA